MKNDVKFRNLYGGRLSSHTWKSRYPSHKHVMKVQKNKPGIFIVIEGLDGSGKTSGINYILNYLRKRGYTVIRGIKVIPKINLDFFYICSFFKEDIIHIKPNLKKGNIILQDRWIYSFLSYEPKNSLIEMIFKNGLTSPDLLIYFTSSKNKIIERLQKLHYPTIFDKKIIQNPNLIIQRQKRYDHYFTNHNGAKVKINTTYLTLKNGEVKLAAIIKNFLIKRRNK